MSKTTIEDRFWAKVEKTDTCWNWTGAIQDGYGRIGIGSKVGYAHRVSYEMHVCPIPDGMVIDHICHNPSCVNPDHLRLATVKQNAENKLGAHANSTSGIRGVSWHKGGRKWIATVCHNRRKYYLGLFADVAEAEAAVIAKRLDLFTHNDVDRIKHPRPAAPTP